MAVQCFDFDFLPSARCGLALLGVTPHTTGVTVTAAEVRIRYGPWRAVVPHDNIRAVAVTGPFAWYKAIGPRLSLADHGVTLGTNALAGVCVQLWQPVALLLPGRLVKHPAITVTVARPRELAACLQAVAVPPATRG